MLFVNKSDREFRAVRRMMRSARCLLIVMAAVLILAGSASAKQKAGSSGARQKIRIAVADTSKSVSSQMIRFLKQCGMKANQVKSSAVNPELYDGLVIPGGPDIKPTVYHAKRDKHTKGCRLGKDRLQLKILKKFVNAGKPVLGVCRGCQLINVAFGGTLKQHVGRYRVGKKAVKVARSSAFFSACGSSTKMYHNHHQCTGSPGKDIVYTMYSPDHRIVEGLQHRSLPVYGVQWHPERSGSKGKKVGYAFKKICMKYRENS